MNDFEHGINFIKLALSVKLVHWTRLPWRLAAFAHPYESVARRNMIDCCQMFDELSGDEQHLLGFEAPTIMLNSFTSV